MAPTPSPDLVAALERRKANPAWRGMWFPRATPLDDAILIADAYPALLAENDRLRAMLDECHELLAKISAVKAECSPGDLATAGLALTSVISIEAMDLLRRHGQFKETP